jgi:hypothetical protein
MSVMRKSLLAALLLAAAATAAVVGIARPGPSSPETAPAAAAAPFPPLLGIVPDGQQQGLVRIDPDTLRPRRGRRVGVGSEGCAPSSGGQACWTVPPWSFSPDESRLAVGRHDQGVARSLRIVDVDRLRVAADIPIADGAVGLLAWLAPRRVLMVQDVCCEELQQLVAVDVARRRVVARRALRGTVQRIGRTPRELVLLVAPAKEVAPARLAVADRRGGLRFVGLERILAGVKLLNGGDYRVEQSVPGLAVDPERRRAFVTAPGLVAEVDLVDLAVSYREPRPSASALARLLDWLDPAAYAKGASGPTRTALWLGDGLLAVTGTDEESFTDARGRDQMRLRAAGLSLVDTRCWSVRTIDRGATAVDLAGELLLATGWSSDSATGESEAIGLTAYGFDGAERFQLFDGHVAWVEQVYDARAYVGVSRPDGRRTTLRVVDLDAGRTAGGERTRHLPWLVLDAASGRWDG